MAHLERTTAGRYAAVPPSTGDQRQSPADEEPTPREGERVAELESELDSEPRRRRSSNPNSPIGGRNQELRDERDRLESELADARAEIDQLDEQLDEQNDDAAGGTRLSAGEAINGTNLFVRYDSKGKATLEEASDGEASREEVEATSGWSTTRSSRPRALRRPDAVRGVPRRSHRVRSTTDSS